MSILGQQIAVLAKVGRSTSNALNVEIVDTAGQMVATAQQKFSAGVLFGFKNGGKSRYTLTAGNRQITVDVAGTTTISEGDSVLGQVVPHDGAARIDDAAGSTLALVRPYAGLRADEPWVHPILSPHGGELGTLGLMRSKAPFFDRDLEMLIDHALFDWPITAQQSLKVPSMGVSLRLTQPVDARLGDLLVCACVDFSVLPRGYVSS
jgi:hypothetical protein